MNELAYIIQGTQITVFTGDSVAVVSIGDHRYDALTEALKAEDWNQARDVLARSVAKEISQWGQGKIEVRSGSVFYGDLKLGNALSDKIISMIDNDWPLGPMEKFIGNLLENPSKRAVDELFGFLEQSNMAITPDGCFVAYKLVRADYTDTYSGTISNRVGEVVKMRRNEVTDDKDRTCAAGLHFCSIGYLRSYTGQRLMALKINPRDVVSIPIDYNNTKGRCCQYEVIAELDRDDVLSNNNDVLNEQPVYSVMADDEDDDLEDIRLHVLIEDRLLDEDDDLKWSEFSDLMQSLPSKVFWKAVHNLIDEYGPYETGYDAREELYNFYLEVDDGGRKIYEEITE